MTCLQMSYLSDHTSICLPHLGRINQMHLLSRSLSASIMVMSFDIYINILICKHAVNVFLVGLINERKWFQHHGSANLVKSLKWHLYVLKILISKLCVMHTYLWSAVILLSPSAPASNRPDLHLGPVNLIRLSTCVQNEPASAIFHPSSYEPAVWVKAGECHIDMNYLKVVW